MLLLLRRASDSEIGGIRDWRSRSSHAILCRNRNPYEVLNRLTADQPLLFVAPLDRLVAMVLCAAGVRDLKLGSPACRTEIV
jgi:hypothetical protein